MLGLGMADALIIKLSQLDQLTVLPTSAVFRFNTRNKDVVAIGKDLGVEGVLDGTVQRDGDWVRVTAQLIRLSDGKTVWTAKFDERYRSLFVLQDSISEQLSLSLRPQVTAAKRLASSQPMTSNTEAYQDYLTGIYFWNRRTKENLPKAIQYLEQATQKDPNFAKAHAVLGDCHFLSLTDEYRTQSPEESLRRAEESINRALELDDTLAEAHTTKASLLLIRGNVTEAGQQYQRALDLSPNSSTAHLRYSYFLYADLRLEAAVDHMRRAQELDPVSAVSNAALAGMLYSVRDYDAAISHGRKAVELEPESVGGYLNLGDAYIQKRMFTEAHQAFDSVIRKNPRYAYWEKAYAYAFAGRREESLRMMAEVEKLKLERSRNHYNYALVYGAMGDIDKAFEELDQVRWGRMRLAQLKYDPQFDPLRNDERFKKILKRERLE
jgi:TolB-like protein/tetratricopeptide (TPR) repeat protein